VVDTGQRIPTQGWKLHVSSRIKDITGLLISVVPLLLERHISFKIPASLERAIKINSGEFGVQQIGKILTAYPSEARDLEQLALCIDQKWQSSGAPVIITDLRFHANSSVYFRYGAFLSPPVSFDAHGWPSFVLSVPVGSRDPSSPKPCSLPFVTARPREHQFRSGFRMHRYRLAVAVCLQRTSRATVYLAVDQTCQNKILKVALSGHAEDATGMDSVDRLEREFAILRQLSIAGIRCPRPLSFRRTRFGGAMLLDEIRGLSLTDSSLETLQAALPQLAEAVAELHRFGVAHRDVKLSNAILSGNQIVLVDFELSATIGVLDPPQGGTRGYYERSQSERTASTQRDIFALGACIAHAFLGVDPALLPSGAGRLVGLLHAIGAHQAANITKAAMGAESRRPSARELVNLMQRLCVPAGAINCPGYLRSDGTRVRRKTLRQIAESAATNHRQWLLRDLTTRVALPSLATGVSGVLLSMMTVDTAFNTDRFRSEIRAAADWVANYPSQGPAYGLFSGLAGLAVTLSVLSKRLRRPDLLLNAFRRLEMAARNTTESDLFSGRAGVVLAATLIADIVGDPQVLELVEPVVAALEALLLEKENLPVWAASSDSPRYYLGTAHGSAGIALALCSWGRARNHQRIFDLGVDVFRRIHRHGLSHDNSSLRVEATDAEVASAGIWCHGPAGYAWAILRSVGDEPRVTLCLDWAVQCLSRVNLLPEPGYCHGVAGQLEISLMMSQIDRYRRLGLWRAKLMRPHAHAAGVP
jgi:hypothetical protein